MVGGTAPAVTVQTNSVVTVQTNSVVTVLLTYLADVGRWQNWCAAFTILSLLSIQVVFRFSSLAFTPSRTLTRHILRQLSLMMLC